MDQCDTVGADHLLKRNADGSESRAFSGGHQPCWRTTRRKLANQMREHFGVSF
jgi:hypothetical protein